MDQGLLEKIRENGADAEALARRVAAKKCPHADTMVDSGGVASNTPEWLALITRELADRFGFPSASALRGELLADGAVAQALVDRAAEIAQELPSRPQPYQVSRALALYVDAARRVGRADFELAKPTDERIRLMFSVPRSMARTIRVRAAERGVTISRVGVELLEAALTERKEVTDGTQR